MAVYKMSRYPREIELRDGSKATVRPMEAGDASSVVALFRRIPEDERFFLNDDVASEEVVKGWAEHLDYDRALPLLALDGDRVVADAVLIRHRGGYRRHKAEIREVIDPDFRGKGLGVALITELTDIAWDAELEHVEFQLIRGMQDAAIEAAEFAGAFSVGTLTDSVKDSRGNLHDLVVLRIPLGKWWQWSRY